MPKCFSVRAPRLPAYPYGESDFRRIRRNRWLYVDKTRFLRRLEEERYAFLIRPRRFGKSLWVSLLENYYDATFAGTDIGQGPTEEHSRYVVLRFNFWMVNDKTLERGVRELLSHRALGDAAAPSRPVSPCGGAGTS